MACDCLISKAITQCQLHLMTCLAYKTIISTAEKVDESGWRQLGGQSWGGHWAILNISVIRIARLNLYVLFLFDIGLGCVLGRCAVRSMQYFEDKKFSDLFPLFQIRKNIVTDGGSIVTHSTDGLDPHINQNQSKNSIMVEICRDDDGILTSAILHTKLIFVVSVKCLWSTLHLSPKSVHLKITKNKQKDEFHFHLSFNPI